MWIVEHEITVRLLIAFFGPYSYNLLCCHGRSILKFMLWVKFLAIDLLFLDRIHATYSANVGRMCVK